MIELQDVSPAPFESVSRPLRPLLFPITLGCGPAGEPGDVVLPLRARRAGSIVVGNRIHQVERRGHSLVVTQVSCEAAACSVHMRLQPGLPDLAWLGPDEQLRTSWTLGIDDEPAALIGELQAHADDDCVHLTLEAVRGCRVDDPPTPIQLMGVNLESWPCELKWHGRLILSATPRLVTDHVQML